MLAWDYIYIYIFLLPLLGILKAWRRGELEGRLDRSAWFNQLVNGLGINIIIRFTILEEYEHGDGVSGWSGSKSDEF